MRGRSKTTGTQNGDFEVKSAVDAARELGAQVLLQVNAIESFPVRPRSSGGWQRNFYRSNSNAEKLASTPISEERAAAITPSYFLRREEQSTPRARTAVDVNVTAVRTDTGAAIWFYSDRFVEAAARTTPIDAHYLCSLWPERA